MATKLKEAVSRFKPRAREFWANYKRNRLAVACLVILIVLVVLSLCMPLVISTSPFTTGPDILALPNFKHWMGTDQLGRDIFIGVFHGLKISLSLGLVAAACSIVLGVIVGTFSAYYGGRVDDVLMRSSDLTLTLPRLLLLLVISSIYGASIWNVVLVVALLVWPQTARIMRSQVLSLKEREFVLASKAIGVRDREIMFSEILPNAIPPVIVNASIMVSYAILLEAMASFLGMGDPSMKSLGYMLHEVAPFFRTAWWTMFFPGFFLFLAIFSLNLVGDGLNEAFNPTLRKR